MPTFQRYSHKRDIAQGARGRRLLLQPVNSRSDVCIWQNEGEAMIHIYDECGRKFDIGWIWKSWNDGRLNHTNSENVNIPREMVFSHSQEKMCNTFEHFTCLNERTFINLIFAANGRLFKHHRGKTPKYIKIPRIANAVQCHSQLPGCTMSWIQIPNHKNYNHFLKGHKFSRIVFVIELLSFCWSGHVFALLWSNVGVL